jgi:hypothetical protein
MQLDKETGSFDSSTASSGSPGGILETRFSNLVTRYLSDPESWNTVLGNPDSR